MTPEVLAIGGGVVLLVLAALGGGIEAKEIRVPQISSVTRALCAIAGIALVGTGIFLRKTAGAASPSAGGPLAASGVSPTVPSAPTALMAPTNMDKLFGNKGASSDVHVTDTSKVDPTEATKPTAPSELSPPRPKVGLSKTTFVFPGDGKKNNNQSIGPFCCTGETATIQTSKGVPVGFIYFYDFDGGYILSPTKSVATSIKVLVSGASDLLSPGNSQVQDMLVFPASSSPIGSSKSVVVGNLRFTAYLAAATGDNSVAVGFVMDSVGIRVDVELLNP